MLADEWKKPGTIKDLKLPESEFKEKAYAKYLDAKIRPKRDADAGPREVTLSPKNVKIKLLRNGSTEGDRITRAAKAFAERWVPIQQ